MAMMNLDVLVESLGATNKLTLQRIRTKLCSSGSEGIAKLAVALRHNNHQVAVQAAVVLGMLQQKATPALPALFKITGSSHVELRRASIASLGRICQRAEDSLSPLAQALKDEDIIVRQHAAAAIGMFSYAAIAVVDNLVLALSDSDSTVRYFALSSLEGIHPLPARILAPLYQIQRDSELYIKLGIRRIISEIEVELEKIQKSADDTLGQALINRGKKHSAVI